MLYQRRAGYFAVRELWDLAESSYARSLDYQGSNGKIWFCLADAQEKTGKPQKAAESYGKAIKTAPHLEGPRSNLAILFAGAGDLETAETLLVEELKMNPGSKPPARIYPGCARKGSTAARSNLSPSPVAVNNYICHNHQMIRQISRNHPVISKFAISGREDPINRTIRTGGGKGQVSEIRRRCLSGREVTQAKQMVVGIPSFCVALMSGIARRR